MKPLLLTLLIFLSLQTNLQAQNSESLGKGIHTLSASYGFLNSLQYQPDLEIYPTGFEYQSSKSFGPIRLFFEFPVSNSIGIIPQVQYAHRKWEYEGGFLHWESTAYGLGALGAYHFNRFIKSDKLDVYTALGASLSSVFQQMKALAPGSYISSQDANFLQVRFISLGGVRYYLSKGFGVFVEGGSLGYSYIDAGITLRRGGR